WDPSSGLGFSFLLPRRSSSVLLHSMYIAWASNRNHYLAIFSDLFVPASGLNQQFVNMLPGGIGDPRSAHHSRQLFDALGTFQRLHAGDGATVANKLFDMELVTGKRCNLCQM